MQRRIIAIFFMIILCNSLIVFSQEKQVKIYKNAFTINIAQLAMLDVNLGYERTLSERSILRTTIGYKFPLSSDSYTNFSGFLLTIPVYFPVSQGPLFSLGYLYFINPRSRLYLSPEVYYRYSYFEKKLYKYCTGMSSDSYVSLQSRYLTKYGIRCLIGKKVSLKSDKQTRIQLDFFAGMGLEYSQQEMTIYAKRQGTCSVIYHWDSDDLYVPPLEENQYRWLPSVTAGIMISLNY
jgi:hypothetical protein